MSRSVADGTVVYTDNRASLNGALRIHDRAQVGAIDGYDTGIGLG